VSEDDSLRKKLPPAKLAFQVLIAIGTPVLLSWLGVAGTRAGLLAGPLLAAAGPTALDHWTAIARRRARSRFDDLRKQGMSAAEATSEIQLQDVQSRKQVKAHWKWVVPVALALGVLSFFAVTGMEEAFGKPVADIVRHKAGHGTTVGGTHPATPPPPAYTPPPVPSATPPAATVTVTTSPSPSPSLSPSSSSPGLGGSTPPGPSVSTSSSQPAAVTPSPGSSGPVS